MILLYVASIITMAKAAPFSTHATSSFKTMPDTISRLDTISNRVYNKTIRKEQTDFLFGKNYRFYIAHHTKHARRRLRRSYQRTHDQDDDSSKSQENISDSSSEPTNIGDNPSVRSITLKDATKSLISSTSSPSNSLHNTELRNEKEDEIIFATTKKENRKTNYQDVIDDNGTKVNSKAHIIPEDELTSSYTNPHIMPTPNPNESDVSRSETNMSGIVIVSVISIILSSSIFVSNLLVIIPFSRCTRVRSTPSNFLLLVLSVSDLLIGIVVIPLVTITTILR